VSDRSRKFSAGSVWIAFTIILRKELDMRHSTQKLAVITRAICICIGIALAVTGLTAEAQSASGSYTEDTRRDATEAERQTLLRSFLVTRDERALPDATRIRLFLSDAMVVRGLDRSINEMLTTADPGPVPYYCPSFSSSCFCNGIMDCIDLQLSGRCGNGGSLEEHGGGWSKCPQGPGASEGCDIWGECP
jgi:hypothetical protein